MFLEFCVLESHTNKYFYVLEKFLCLLYFCPNKHSVFVGGNILCFWGLYFSICFWEELCFWIDWLILEDIMISGIFYLPKAFFWRICISRKNFCRPKNFVLMEEFVYWVCFCPPKTFMFWEVLVFLGCPLPYKNIFRKDFVFWKNVFFWEICVFFLENLVFSEKNLCFWYHFV